MNSAKLRELYAAKLAEARQLASQWQGKEAECPKEITDKISALLGQADEIKARLDLALRVEAGEQYLEDPQATKAAHLGWRTAGPDEGDVEFDAKSWREVEYKDVFGLVRRLRYYVPLALQRNEKLYSSAFEAYLRRAWDRIGPNDRKTLSEGTDSAGGFLVPPDVQGEIIKKVAANAAIRPLASVRETSRDTVLWPKIVYTADDRYTSGVRLKWTGEVPSSSSVHRATDPVFGVEQIPIHTAMASMPVTNDLLEDAAFNVIGLCTDLLAEAFALGEDDAFINGTGVGQPEGILTHPSASIIHTSGGMYVKSGSASALTADGLIDLESALPAQYERRAVWVMNKKTKGAIRKLKTSSGEYLWPVVPLVGQLGTASDTLLGYNVVKDEFMPDIAANAFPIIFGDLQGYLIADRVGLSIQVLRELYAETNITLLLARKRVGGQLIEPYRLRVQKCEAP